GGKAVEKAGAAGRQRGDPVEAVDVALADDIDASHGGDVAVRMNEIKCPDRTGVGGNHVRRRENLGVRGFGGGDLVLQAQALVGLEEIVVVQLTDLAQVRRIGAVAIVHFQQEVQR